MSRLGYKVRPAGSAHEAIERFINECGGNRAVSEVIGRSPATVAAWSDPDGRDGAPGVGFAHASLLTRYFGSTVLAEHMARCAGGTFVPGISATDEPITNLGGELAESMGRMLHQILDLGDADVSAGDAKGRELLASVEMVSRILGDIRGTLMRRNGEGA